jgi:probable DNA metabolism protein
MCVVYDGSLEGFLTLIYDVYYSKLSPTSILKVEPQELMYEPLHFIVTDTSKAHKVLESLVKKFSRQNYKKIFHIFLCDSISFEMALVEYIMLGFKDQMHLENITNASIFFLQNQERELLRLAHKMYGFTRFEELDDGTLYAKIETKYNVLPFLGEHFKRRLGNTPFIIHDIKRSLAYTYSKEEASIKNIASFDTPTLSSHELTIQMQWKTFFNHVAIETRRNEKLQKQLVPLLYRAYMREFQQ